MDPFFRRHWHNFAPQHQYQQTNVAPQHQYPHKARQVPVQRRADPSPKVVSIPVQYVGLERRRSDSALKIQKAFRGFLVRKSVRKIAAIRVEVGEIEKRISKREAVELMRRDAKERLKVNETLMNLLLKLDSVKGVDSGVRDVRRAVIKKAIALQEKVDSAVAENPQIDQTLELQSESPVNSDETQNSQSLELESAAEPQIESVPHGNAWGCREEECSVSDSESSGSSCDDSPNPMEDGVEDVKVVEREEAAEEEGAGQIVKDDENKRSSSRELLERVAEDNAKMMGMMEELFEKNQMQMRMLSSLSQRVEQLERALVCERLRRRKRRHAAATADFVSK
ncbi:BAG family molecular chaperone regulator 5 [Pyrus ussuriensis x Pyrus communis]|uniref:BAG family molecular chaperone regulator 5 n=1 Tax=Pyrus ussuriensis x Pyrus communis TaxID=2448454 RepID=A0A5N5F809_9ROSA|nr:BAG family molecular chaperone regulator 5 [Pyrus ussuriensis x Pyrus communis]